jgi:hypothetical protein
MKFAQLVSQLPLEPIIIINVSIKVWEVSYLSKMKKGAVENLKHDHVMLRVHDMNHKSRDGWVNFSQPKIKLFIFRVPNLKVPNDGTNCLLAFVNNILIQLSK